MSVGIPGCLHPIEMVHADVVLPPCHHYGVCNGGRWWSNYEWLLVVVAEVTQWRWVVVMMVLVVGGCDDGAG